MVSTLLSLQNGYQCRFYFQRECKTGCKVTKKAVKEKHPMAQATPESDFCAVVFCLCQSAIRLCMRRLSNIFVSFYFLTLILNFYNIIAFYASEKYLFGNKLFAFAEFGEIVRRKSKRRRGVDFPFAFLYNNYGLASPYKMPCAIIAFATFMNPATLAPFT